MSPLMMLWLVVVFDGLESEMDSLARVTEITTSLLLIGAVSCDDIRSSEGDKMGDGHILSRGHVEDLVSSVKGECTLSLDVRDVQSFLESKDDNTKL